MAWPLVFFKKKLHNFSCEFDEISSEISLSIDSSIANRSIRRWRQNSNLTWYVEHVLRPPWPQFIFQFSFAANRSSEMQNKTVFFNLYCSAQVPLSRISISIGIIFPFILNSIPSTFSWEHTKSAMWRQSVHWYRAPQITPVEAIFKLMAAWKISREFAKIIITFISSSSAILESRFASFLFPLKPC